MTAFSTTGHSTTGLSTTGLSTTARPTARSVLARLLVPAIAVAWLAEGPALAQESGEVARIEALSGVVTVVREAGDVAASPGLHLLAGDSLETAPGARAELLFADGTTLVVGPEAEVKLEDYLLAADGSREHGAVTLVEGVVRAVVAPGPADSFAIQGQAAVASVRGTELLMIEEDDTTSVFVVEGHVIMQGPVGVWLVKLAPGEGADARLEPAAAASDGTGPGDVQGSQATAVDGEIDRSSSAGALPGADAPAGGASDTGGIVIVAPAPPAAPTPAPSPVPAPAASRDAGPVALPRTATQVVAGPRPEVDAWSPQRVEALLALTSLP